MARNCVVVGAGVAGLSAAWTLEKQGIRTTVLEAEPYVGGRTRTVAVGGSTLNTGAAFFTSFYDETLALCRELGVPLVQPKVHPSLSYERRSIATPSGAYPYGPGTLAGFLAFPLVSPANKLRFLCTMVGLLFGGRTHIAEPRSMVHLDSTDVRSWAEPRVGTDAYDYFVKPTVEPFFYMSAEEVSSAVAITLLRHAIRWRLWTPGNGMGAFCDAMASRLDVRLSHDVIGVDESRDSVRVHTNECSLRADAVVLALPPHAVLRLTGPISPQDRRILEDIEYEASIALFLGYDRRLGMRPPSVMSGGPRRQALVGVTSLGDAGVPDLVPDGKDVVVVLAMGWRSRELLGRPQTEIVDELLGEVANLGLRLPAPEWRHVVARRHATVVPRPGYFRDIVAFADRRRARIHFAGDWLAGSSTVEGAVRSGNAAARAVLQDFSRGA